MKLKTVTMLAVFVLAMSGLGNLYADIPWLHVEGNKLKDPSGNNVVLRGVSLIDLGAQQKNYDRTVLQILDMISNKSDPAGSSPGWYTKIVRLPVSPQQYNSPFTFNPGSDDYYNQLLRPAVDACKAKDMYCIIDLHFVDLINVNPTYVQQFWTYMAPKFANDSHVMFELFNEPSNNSAGDAGDWAAVKVYMQQWTNLVRQYAPNNIILIGTAHWCQLLYEAAISPVSGTNLIYVSHIYASHWQYDWFRNEIPRAAPILPLIQTEWGFSQSQYYEANGTITLYGQPLDTQREQYGVSNTAWCVSTDWGPPMYYSGWTLRVGEGEMGGFVKDRLYALRNSNMPVGGGTPGPITTVAPVVTPGPTSASCSCTLGDVNCSGTIDIVDALLVAQAYVGITPANYFACAADVTKDGIVDILDALRIAQCFVGLSTCSF